VLAGGAVGLVAALGVGGAVAATGGSPQEESRALVEDVAKRLGLDAGRVETALEEAYAARVDAAVKEGRLTAEEGAALKQRIAAGEVPLLGGRRGFGHRHGPGHRLASATAAADYLGLTEAQLRGRLLAGKTLAEVAADRGKSVDGLEKTLTDAARKQVAEAVAAGRLTEARGKEILTDLPERIQEHVTRTFRPHRHDRLRGDAPPETQDHEQPGTSTG
jgi:polyhydroxyalkanoate synthesis regulator phasin